MMNRRFHCTTTGVPHHHYQVGSEMFNCILDTSQLMIINNISGHTDYKQFSNPRRKNTLRNNP